jgi:hypothetical protein
VREALKGWPVSGFDDLKENGGAFHLFLFHGWIVFQHHSLACFNLLMQEKMLLASQYCHADLAFQTKFY